MAIHSPGEADLNVYAYVSGSVLKNIDPLGLLEETAQQQTLRENFESATAKHDIRISEIDESLGQLRQEASGWAQKAMDPEYVKGIDEEYANFDIDRDGEEAFKDLLSRDAHYQLERLNEEITAHEKMKAQETIDYLKEKMEYEAAYKRAATGGEVASNGTVQVILLVGGQASGGIRTEGDRRAFVVRTNAIVGPGLQAGLSLGATDGKVPGQYQETITCDGDVPMGPFGVTGQRTYQKGDVAGAKKGDALSTGGALGVGRAGRVGNDI